MEGATGYSGTYTPGATTSTSLDGNPNFTGSVADTNGTVNTTINFSEFNTSGRIITKSFSTFTFAGSSTNDNVTESSSSANVFDFSGTVAGGVALVPLRLQGTTSIKVNGGSGNDKLTVDYSTGNPVPTGGVSYDGGTGTSDQLVVTGYSVAQVTSTYTGPHSGTVQVVLCASLISYKNLTPLTLTGTAANLIIDLSQTGVQNPDVVLGDDGGVGDPDATQNAGVSAIHGSTFEYTQFNNPTSSLTVDLGPTNDNITVQAMDAAFAVTTNLNGGVGNNVFNVQASSAAIAIQGQGGNDSVNVGNGNLDNIKGLVSVVGAAGTDSISLDDSANGTAANYNYTVTPTGVTSTLGNGNARTFAGVTFDATTETVYLGRHRRSKHFQCDAQRYHHVQYQWPSARLQRSGGGLPEGELYRHFRAQIDLQRPSSGKMASGSFSASTG